jgi:hypothetical protein
MMKKSFYSIRIQDIMDANNRLPAGYVPIPGSGVFPHAADALWVDPYQGEAPPVSA